MGRHKVRETTNIEKEITRQPMPNYHKITCPFTTPPPPKCWVICGLTCAEDCVRYPDYVCLGCPCK